LFEITLVTSDIKKGAKLSEFFPKVSEIFRGKPVRTEYGIGYIKRYEPEKQIPFTVRIPKSNLTAHLR
jgi:hypothetical protein